MFAKTAKRMLAKNILSFKGINQRASMLNICNKKFSSGHGHAENTEDNYHDRKFDRISYNRKLGPAEREKIVLTDTLNEPETDWLKPAFNIYIPQMRYEVLVPYDKIQEDREDTLLDRTEIHARIYNLLRQFDFMPLDLVDFDGDYEKDLGLDSLEWTAMVTSIEHEFHTVFEDTLFDHFRTINDFVSIIEKDFYCF